MVSVSEGDGKAAEMVNQEDTAGTARDVLIGDVEQLHSYCWRDVRAAELR